MSKNQFKKLSSSARNRVSVSSSAKTDLKFGFFDVKNPSKLYLYFFWDQSFSQRAFHNELFTTSFSQRAFHNGFFNDDASFSQRAFHNTYFSAENHTFFQFLVEKKDIVNFFEQKDNNFTVALRMIIVISKFYSLKQIFQKMSTPLW